MKRHFAGTSGSAVLADPSTDDGLDLEESWSELIRHLTGNRPLRPVQRRAVEEVGILDSRRNLVVTAPTNSGKSLIGYLLLFDAVARGQRAVLLEPLRALAQEKADELRELAQLLPAGTIGAGASVQITTGDYRLEGESFSDAPPESGEIVVATPERLQAILRGPANQLWVERIGAVVVDEAHLLGSAHRGPALEFVLAVLKSLPAPPRLGLLSATIGEPQTLSNWLDPCDLLNDTDRHPPLDKWVLEVEGDESADDIVSDEVKLALADPKSSVLVFVYQRAACQRLCRRLSEDLGLEFPTEAVQPYHSGMSATARRKVRDGMIGGSIRCVVATTSLAMGVNLPATHVIVRDVMFFGSGPVPTDQLLQMMGRAGRGERPGTSMAIVKPADGRKANEVTEELRLEVLPEIRSQLISPSLRRGRRKEPTVQDGEEIAETIAGFLARAGDEGISEDELGVVITNTLAGAQAAGAVPAGLAWLDDNERVLAFRDEREHVRLTALGKAGVRAALPLSHTSGLGQLFRDLLSVDAEGKMLGAWTPLDHLLLAELLSSRSPRLGRFSERLAEEIDAWMERQPQEAKSVLFRSWIAGAKGSSRAIELIGSLGSSLRGSGRATDEDQARSFAYQATFSAIILWERANGASCDDLARRWGLKAPAELAGVEESWRDTMIWLVSGQASLFEVRCFYHHLITDCEAGQDRVDRVKLALRRMQFQSRELQDTLRYCSPLGPLLRGVRGMMRDSKQASAGIGTIRALEGAGIESMRDLVSLEIADLVRMGVQKRFAKQIRTYIARRLA